MTPTDFWQTAALEIIVAQLAPTEPLSDLSSVLAQLETKAPLQTPQNGSAVQKWLTSTWLILSKNYFQWGTRVTLGDSDIITHSHVTDRLEIGYRYRTLNFVNATSLRLHAVLHSATACTTRGIQCIPIHYIVHLQDEQAKRKFLPPQMPNFSWDLSKFSTKSPRYLFSKSTIMDSKTILIAWQHNQMMHFSKIGKGSSKSIPLSRRGMGWHHWQPYCSDLEENPSTDFSGKKSAISYMRRMAISYS
jgi:hypothetical protein